MLVARRLSIAVTVASLLIAAPAWANEPNAADSESALQLYKDGKALRESGDLPGALAKLRAAYALVATPITATELGRAYIASGQLVEAREVLLTVPRIPLRANESAKAAEARTDAEHLAAELRPRLASVTVKPKNVPPGVVAKLSVDGVVVPPEASSVPRVLNPGNHVVLLEANGQRVQTDVTLAEGQARDVEVELPAAVDPNAGQPPATSPPPESGPRKISPLVYVGFGTAIVGIGVGTVTGIMTLSTASSLKDSCRDGKCPASAQSDIDSTSTTGAISTIGFAVGAAGLVVGVVGLVLSGKRGESALTAPTVTRTSGLRILPTANGFAGSF